MYLKLIRCLISILLLLQGGSTTAQHISLENASPEALKTMLENISLSSSVRTAIENCQVFRGENRRACLKLFSENENESVTAPQLSPLENCKVFSGAQFRICVEMYMLEAADTKKSSSIKFCKNFTGKTFQFCSEMPTPFIAPNCKTCAAEKLRFCTVFYLPTNNETENTNTSPFTTQTTKLVPSTPSLSTLTTSKTKRITNAASIHTTPTTPGVRNSAKPKNKRKKQKSTANPINIKTSFLASTSVSTAAPLPKIQRRKRSTAASIINDCNCHHDHHYSEKEAKEKKQIL